MLVLSRREGEEILVPDCGVTVKVLSVQGNKIRLGIRAPAEVEVLRGELWDRELQEARREPVPG
ncbi:MAG: carbon storage regulator [Zavarzinella sp.]|nr:carbon storage regulator [Zavarzinella sp.]